MDRSLRSGKDLNSTSCLFLHIDLMLTCKARIDKLAEDLVSSFENILQKAKVRKRTLFSIVEVQKAQPCTDENPQLEETTLPIVRQQSLQMDLEAAKMVRTTASPGLDARKC